ncbi:hypothetical protein BCR41DRAFT_361950 [Lobosporangium transversale]|uniref:EF-hand domain-containing protein n=1 Tax=Lobosporangium transversale TaxID=64571 RepID=A0A1Y2GCP6_9FUNG|nr:hypothetical protein BCR41DRAFT_361950 [Lobosporangium transversale]ORZ05360.1 hypothetical protein BCR41DRAFT_361950 [Lobosporangium transversale]|eukprot:XP_021877052.1 hypothetical protein BCR41DRAFT_361950 [Lobosporangium transversale]
MATPQQNINFTPEELAKFKEAFTSYDKTRTLKQLAASVGQEASDEELGFVIKAFDTNGDGELDFDEFLGLLATLRSASRDF